MPRLILLLSALALLPACTPLVVATGAAAVVVADEVVEQENGGDGLF
ncbi:hypothetical protein [Actibacterium mucosum]|nr:hypothetical protein [Actibacterium mucosum]